MDFIPYLDNALSVEDRVKLLEQARQQIIDFDNALHDERLKLSEQDIELLRHGLARSPRPTQRYGVEN